MTTGRGSTAATGAASAERLRALVDAGVALTGTLELDAVLRRIVRIACRVVGARYGALGVLDPRHEGLSAFVFHGVSKAEAARIGPLPKGRGILGALIRDERSLRLDDLTADARSVGFPTHHPPMRTFLGVPVVCRGTVFGNLYLTEKRGGDPFTDEDEHVAAALAAQAGVAVDNARLFADARAREREARSRVRELDSLQEIGRALLGELHAPRVLRLVAGRAKSLTRADTAVIAVRADDGEHMVLDVVVGSGARAARGMRAPLASSMAGRTMRTRAARRIDDLDARPDVYAPISHALGAKSAMFAPLVDRDSSLGVLAVAHRSLARFDDHDLSVLQALADLASLALRNAHLFDEQRERVRAQAQLESARVQTELKADLLRQVIRAQEDERARIARDLHDSTAQALASILLGLKVAEQQHTLADTRAQLAELRGLTSDAVAEMRRLALELRPTALDDLGLPAALDRYARDFERRHGITTRVRVPSSTGRLEPEVETVVYRVAQEALTNVARHSDAATVRLDLLRRNGRVRLRVRDDGTGFDPATRGTGNGLGLEGMRERVELVGGRLKVSSSDAGTTIVAEVPAP